MPANSNTTVANEWLGAPLEDLDTPALLLNRQASDRNLRMLANFFRDRRTRLRPHFKNHKCVTLAQRQLAAGSAVGMTCAHIGEAEVLVDGGIDDLLIANQVVGRHKLERLATLARRADVKVAVDDIVQAEAVSRAAASAGVTVGILIEVDIGMGRCGVASGQAALRLAQSILPLAGLRLDGIQSYEGHAVYIDDVDERSRLVRESFERAVGTRRLLEQNGIDVRILSGGSSATHRIAGRIDGVDEIQAGTYATMDWRYAQMLPDFGVALAVLARVISRRENVAVIDAGIKAVGCEFGLPRIRDYPDVQIPAFVAEEHCVVRNVIDWQVGDVVHLLPSHACSTCNLYRRMFVHEDGRVVDVWPIEASGY
jgi:D-serine deaminase-like pyridoxal phosphate-dependent protein